ncbi:UPF0149 family protein [Acidiphilium multivorum]|uniref:UPF0149 family protein n=1 Tax=Acidiphilium multivorum TaxID=62140 RepID=UPI001B8AD8D0|nr:UPF0149 family protein [Acidiphilium multivorum]MBS3025245.1 UPF0149 family protein [Acidiphilium multivorum]HQT76436.1 UPF0149 family protein [Rhodopila sp.]
MNDQVDLERLDRFLMSDATPDDCMGLSDLDGFMTGIAVGPDAIMPSEWLPRVWGGEAPVFESAEQAQEIVGAIMGRFNQIVRSLDGHPDDIEPIYWENPEKGIVIAGDWAEGFLEAIDMRREAWSPLLRDPKARVVLLPILALCGEAEGNPLLKVDVDPDILSAAPALIPTCVFAIRAFWRGGTSWGSPLPGSKVGRNDPCPCGSGRKYKRCCGSN